MSSHGKQIMQAVTLILEAEHSIEVKEQVSTPSSQVVFIQNSSCSCTKNPHCRVVLTFCRYDHRLSTWGSAFVQLGMFSGVVVFVEVEAHQRESLVNLDLVLNHKTQNVQIKAPV